MDIHKEVEALSTFVKKWDRIEIRSTGATVVDFSGDLYNVDGSSLDPIIDGLNWKQLLISRGINGNCYVNNVKAPSDSSHPGFDVGGHMTTNKDGKVSTGGTSYLMPLCKWHNSIYRNKMAFSHSQTKMLKLSGYMEGDVSATFMARMPTREKFSAAQVTEKGELGVQHFSEREQLPPNSVLFKHIERDGEFFHIIEDTSLPK